MRTSNVPREQPEPHVQVHHRGERGVDGILRLIELAGHDGPLEAMLTAMCTEIAAIASVDIVSAYVREDDRLVMRGNHGFEARAIGAVALGIGEGITGLVAECLRPVSAAHAAAETAYKHVPGLGEERFPVFVGVPLIGNGSAIGVLVLQRRAEPFAAGEVTLATALGAPVTLAIERRRESAVRSARLTGIAHVGGAVLGRAAVVPTATAFDGAAHAPAEVRIERAFARLREDLSRTVRRLGEATEPAIGGALDRFALALCDARLRERLAAVADQPGGLRTVAKEYARAPYLFGGSRSEAADHASELEELCALLGDARALRPGAVWIGDRLNTFAAITAVARGAAALVASDLIAPAAIAIARAAQLPVVSDVAGLFGWARPGDLLAVDGDRGAVLVHPSPTDIERLRRAR
jgi:phosphotransferase system enzyme I (PtsP)